jgi:8-oxo-dGTP pyrophosphatase MutT (NUDIX family)
VREQPDGSRIALTVAAVGERDGRYLMVEERVDGQRVVNQPAGHVDPGEDLLSAVVREAREETAWAFQANAVVGVYLWHHPAKPRSFLRVAFAGTWQHDYPGQALDTEILAARWFTPDELQRASHLRSPMVLRCLQDHVSGSREAMEPYLALDWPGLLELAEALGPNQAGALLKSPP